MDITEIKSHIFSYIPEIDLLLTIRRVSREWSDCAQFVLNSRLRVIANTKWKSLTHLREFLLRNRFIITITRMLPFTLPNEIDFLKLGGSYKILTYFPNFNGIEHLTDEDCLYLFVYFNKCDQHTESIKLWKTELDQDMFERIIYSLRNKYKSLLYYSTIFAKKISLEDGIIYDNNSIFNFLTINTKMSIEQIIQYYPQFQSQSEIKLHQRINKLNEKEFIKVVKKLDEKHFCHIDIITLSICALKSIHVIDTYICRIYSKKFAPTDTIFGITSLIRALRKSFPSTEYEKYLFATYDIVKKYNTLNPIIGDINTFQFKFYLKFRLYNHQINNNFILSKINNAVDCGPEIASMLYYALLRNNMELFKSLKPYMNSDLFIQFVNSLNHCTIKIKYSISFIEYLAKNYSNICHIFYIPIIAANDMQAILLMKQLQIKIPKNYSFSPQNHYNTITQYRGETAGVNIFDIYKEIRSSPDIFEIYFNDCTPDESAIASFTAISAIIGSSIFGNYCLDPSVIYVLYDKLFYLNQDSPFFQQARKFCQCLVSDKFISNGIIAKIKANIKNDNRDRIANFFNFDDGTPNPFMEN